MHSLVHDIGRPTFAPSQPLATSAALQPNVQMSSQEQSRALCNALRGRKGGFAPQVTGVGCEITDNSERGLNSISSNIFVCYRQKN